MTLSEKIARTAITGHSWQRIRYIRLKIKVSGLRGCAAQSTADAALFHLVKWEFPDNYRKWLSKGGL